MNGLYMAGARRLFNNFLRGGVMNFERSNMYSGLGPKMVKSLGGETIRMSVFQEKLQLWSSNGNGLLDYYDFLTYFRNDDSTSSFFKWRGETKHLVDMLITPYVLAMGEK